MLGPALEHKSWSAKAELASFHDITCLQHAWCFRKVFLLLNGWDMQPSWEGILPCLADVSVISYTVPDIT